MAAWKTRLAGPQPSHIGTGILRGPLRTASALPRWSATTESRVNLLAAVLARLDRPIDATTAERHRLADLYRAGLIDLPELHRRCTEVACPRHETQLANLIAENTTLKASLAEALGRPPEQVDVPVLTDREIAVLESAMEDLTEVARTIATRLSGAPWVGVQPAPAAARGRAVDIRPALPPPPPPPASDTSAPSGKPLGKAERALLPILAQFPDGRSRTQLSLLSGYSIKSSSYSNALGALRSAGFVNRGEPIQITPEGVAAIGDDWEPLPTGDALAEHWMRQLGKAERTILSYLLDAFPTPCTKDDISTTTGYSTMPSSFSNALCRLRSLELVNRGSGIMADPDFAREVGRG